MDVDRKQLGTFLGKAARATYAGDGEEAHPWNPGCREYEYPKGGWPGEPWVYADSYTGLSRFAGRELVYHLQEPVWFRVYHGQMLFPDFAAGGQREEIMRSTFAFLKEALLRGEEGKPFQRGPSSFKNGDWEYKTEVDGDISSFRGTEEVSYQGHLVFRLWYGGGIPE